MPFADLAAEVATEIRLLQAIEAELAAHAAAREDAYRQVDPGQIARTLPGLAEIGGPAMTAIMGKPGRFPGGHHFKSYPGPGPPGQRDRRDRPQGRADEQGRAIPGPGHHDPGRRHRPQATTPSSPGSTTPR